VDPTQTLIPETTELGRYLEDTIDVDWQTPTVLLQAKALAEGRPVVRDRIEACFLFVRDEIVNSADGGPDVITCRASEVLKERAGTSFAKSHLLAALLRALGIPAGFCYQRRRREPPAKGHALHGLNAVYLADEARWIVVDARGEAAGVETRVVFDGPPSLAFASDADAGEVLLPTIFKRPGKRVLDLLGKAPALPAVLEHLPDALV